MSKDITEKKKFEEELTKTLGKYKSVFDNAQDLIIVIDAKGKITEVNKAFERISGYKKEEVIGKNFSFLVTKASLLKIMPKFLASVSTGEVHPPYDIEGINKQGEKIPFEVSGTPIKKDGKVVAIHAILRDLRERKKD